MNDDYLWDKSGEPDPQVQQLEEILGTLRYQERALEIPIQSRRHFYFPVLAIAATVALTLVAAGLWLRAQSQKAHRPEEANIVVPGGTKENVPTPIVPRDEGVVQKSADTVAHTPRPRLNPRNLFAGNVKRVKAPPEAGLTTKEREDALAAKDQLMVALRLASEKLNLAQRRTQSSSPPNVIRNQHKVG